MSMSPREFFVHGSTVTINAVLERKGAHGAHQTKASRCL